MAVTLPPFQMENMEVILLLLVALLARLAVIRRRRRRRQRMIALAIRMHRVATENRKKRRIWRRLRSLTWWTEVVPSFDDSTFLENFRVRWA